ncbi:PAS domain-containing protein [Streptomyces reniochalinae]|uniref:PAS domain-containing protein n=1 Tax=Streptomyces reniochalinae TaxID=2250578 RepID=A0A367EGW6_9ACTN|nr:PAS domain-containing protein [Streptomyces reniochalinae]RCG16952.1 PAS domain-containing protein [Streptomyces reniochalinae]
MSSRPSRGAARLAAILDALPDALLLVNCNGTVVNANAIALEAFETPGTALVGRGLLDLLPEFDSKRIPGSMRRPDETEQAQGRQKPTRMVARRTDGTEFPVEVTSANLEDGRTPYASAIDAAFADHPRGAGYTGDELLMLVVRDLTGTLDTEAELARQQRQTEMILRAASEGVVGVDTAGRVVLVNPAAAHMLGYRASDLGGQELHPLVHHSRPDGAPLPFEETPLADTLRSGRKHRVRAGQVLWAKDGRAVAVDMTTAPVRDGDQLVGAVLTFADRRPYDAVTARQKQLRAVLEESLRGPLEQLREELASLTSDPAAQLWPEANQILHHLSAGYARMTTLLDNVLGYQRLDAGQERLRTEPVPMDAVVSAGVEGAIELIGPGRAQFAVHAPPIEAEVDPERLAVALAHLVADVAGVDATGRAQSAPPAGADPTIVVAAAQRGEVVRIEVRGPYGGGSPVHEPLVRGIVAQHGGVLQTHEVPGSSGGSAYVLEVPVQAVGNTARPSGTRARRGGGTDGTGSTGTADRSAGGATGPGGSDSTAGAGRGGSHARGGRRVQEQAAGGGEGGFGVPRVVQGTEHGETTVMPMPAAPVRGTDGHDGHDQSAPATHQHTDRAPGGAEQPRQPSRFPEPAAEGAVPDAAGDTHAGREQQGGRAPAAALEPVRDPRRGASARGHVPDPRQSLELGPGPSTPPGGGPLPPGGGPLPPGEPSAHDRVGASAQSELSPVRVPGREPYPGPSGAPAAGPGAPADPRSGPGPATPPGWDSRTGADAAADPSAPTGPNGPNASVDTGARTDPNASAEAGASAGAGAVSVAARGVPGAPGVPGARVPAQEGPFEEPFDGPYDDAAPGVPRPTGRRRGRPSPDEQLPDQSAVGTEGEAGDAAGPLALPPVPAQTRGRRARRALAEPAEGAAAQAPAGMDVGSDEVPYPGSPPPAAGVADEFAGEEAAAGPEAGELSPAGGGRRARRIAAARARAQAEAEAQQGPRHAPFALPAAPSPDASTPSPDASAPATAPPAREATAPEATAPGAAVPEVAVPGSGGQQAAEEPAGAAASRVEDDADAEGAPEGGRSRRAEHSVVAASPILGGGSPPQQPQPPQPSQPPQETHGARPGAYGEADHGPRVRTLGQGVPFTERIAEQAAQQWPGPQVSTPSASSAIPSTPSTPAPPPGSGRRRKLATPQERSHGGPAQPESGPPESGPPEAGQPQPAAHPAPPETWTPGPGAAGPEQGTPWTAAGGGPLPAEAGQHPSGGPGEAPSWDVAVPGTAQGVARPGTPTAPGTGAQQPGPGPQPPQGPGPQPQVPGPQPRATGPGQVADPAPAPAPPQGGAAAQHQPLPQPRQRPQQRPQQPQSSLPGPLPGAYEQQPPHPPAGGEDVAEGPEPLDGPDSPVAVTDGRGPGGAPQAMDDELPPEPLDNPRRLLVWPEPDVSTQQALSDRGYRPVLVRSREEVDAQIAAYPAALFVDPLTGPITRTALQSLRTAAVAAEVPVLVTAGLGQATREAAFGADPAVLLKALSPRDSEQHPPRVLLVEERQAIAAAFAATLERRGMRVAHAPTDSEAVNIAAQVRPNLVVMDLMQVRRRRAGIIDWLRVNGMLNRTPFVVYTSADLDPSELPGLASGETVLFLAERSTNAEVQARIVDLLTKIGAN